MKVEHLLREEAVVIGYEMLSCLCDLLLARFSLVESERTLSPELKVALSLCSLNLQLISG